MGRFACKASALPLSYAPPRRAMVADDGIAARVPVRAPARHQDVLADPTWADRLTAEDRRGLTLLFWAHAAPYGEVRLCGCGAPPAATAAAEIGAGLRRRTIAITKRITPITISAPGTITLISVSNSPEVVALWAR